MSGAMNVRQKLAKGRPLVGHSNAGPTISAITGDGTASLGAPKTYSATAVDAEQGDLTSSIVWTVTPPGSPPVVVSAGTGGSVSITFTVSGSNLVTATVTDSFGATDSSTKFVTAT